MDLLKQQSREEWEELLGQIARETSMTVALTDDRGNLVLQTKGERCPLCTKIRENKESLTFICSQCNATMLKEAKESLAPVVDGCDAGLSRMAVPIIRDGTLIGQITACGGTVEEDDINLFLIAKQVGISQGEVETLATLTPRVCEEEIETIAKRTFSEINL